MKKNIIFVFAFFSLAFTSWAAPFNTLSFFSGSKSDLVLEQSDSKGFKAALTVPFVNLSRVELGGKTFVDIEVPGCSQGSGEYGKPLVPVVTRLIEVPRNAEVEVLVHDIKEETVKLDEKAGGLKLLPRQKPLKKSGLKSANALEFNEKFYSINSYGSEERVKVEFKGDIRGVRTAYLTVRPFYYNPATDTLKVATRISFSVVFKNGDIKLTKKIREKYYSPAFQKIFDTILNYPVSDGAKDAIISGRRSWPLTYVVVASNSFLKTDKLKEFMDWKRQLGFSVVEADTGEIFKSSSGLTEDQKRERLKNWLKDLYESGGNTPSYVLFAGDVGTGKNQIPAFKIKSQDGQDTYVTDLYYVVFNENSYLPQAYYGRFPVDSISELNSVVDKTIAYEKYDSVTGAHLGRAMAIAGGYDDASPNYANGQVAYLLNEYLISANGYSEIYAFLNGVSWSWPDVEIGNTASSPQKEIIKTRINEGLGFVNYTGHCNDNGWFNEIYDVYDFGSYDISSLLPDEKYGFYVGNCCESSSYGNSYYEDDSFGEKLVLADKKGAAVYIGASYETYWDQDFTWAVGLKVRIMNLSEDAVKALVFSSTGYGNFDSLWHTHEEKEEKWNVTAGQMVYMGNLSVGQAYHEWAEYYFEVYNVLGDPSIMPFLRVPDIPADPYFFDRTITPCVTENLSVKASSHTRVVLLRNGEPVDVKETGTGDTVNLSFSPFSIYDTAEIRLVSQNAESRKYTVEVEESSGLPPEAFFYIGNDPEAATVEVTAGVPVLLINRSKGCPERVEWTFDGGDPDISSDLEPSVVWNSLGCHDVRLSVKNSLGENDKEKPCYVKVVPALEFSSDKTAVAPGDTVTFTSESSHTPSDYLWEIFLNGSSAAYFTSSEKSPSIRFDNAGSYKVSLRVTVEGEDYSITKDRYIYVNNQSSSDSGGGGGCFIGSIMGEKVR